MAIETGIDLNSCVPGQHVLLRNGKIGTYNGLIDQNVTYTHAIDGYSYTSDGCFWDDDRTSSQDIALILPMEDKPIKTTPEVTHSITDQIDVTNPDHVSIIPSTDGITISIKKGLTTISWRHRNS